MKLSAPDEPDAKTQQMACAALYLEMMMMDDKIVAKEREIISALIRKNFSLTPEQTSDLIELAEKQRKQATDYFQFTSLINKTYTMKQKIRLVESLWKIAYIDGDLDMHEEYLVRKIADLLHVPHTAFLMTKHRISEAD
ncbi:MAG: tellurite resistance TerB family protein [Gammaproteobacteria bacterium]